MSGKALYGLVAEFHSPGDLVKAAHEVHAGGYTKVDAYTPYPMEEVIEALHLGHSLSLIHISEPTRPPLLSRMPSSA